MRHLPKKRRPREVFGHDAAERLENLFAVVGGQGPPQLAGAERAF
jgi:hypothetical protein